ncbi:trehalose operon repressor [Pediococcus claussenii]|uniref:Trehalose operon repressor n=1 Tax=Pediococcus claussenii (strain ATCC BAA-344 / DSM 14800 / JCM 18046 / KCTC 3811 / LMG 21948 / P06) TaxID=701521 RepID=G8PBA1_PEDCP|nr:trehalose operon repressor [Pediococcus claussenii]AEV95890.1 trehalose operon repressor [Pediococcus claussenii ATCC BAA-344]ANZ69384.1 trehalose operon repressor [Pediococcus claussenii]ANZ71204.1 trehalose operon repressor [Pediococcus claussenii]KRN20497.1 treR protein [Pediococcus claussenii]
MKSKYDLIQQDIANKIMHHIYPANSFLPSESQLCDLYGVSRETIRKALALLLEQGYIQKIQGKGSIVLDFSRFTFPVSGIASFKELNQSEHMNSRTKLIKLEDMNVPTEVFQLDKDNLFPATYVERLRIVDSEPIVLDRDYLLKSVVTTLPKVAAEDSLYEYLEGKLGLDIGYATKMITVEPPTPHQQELLHVPDNKDVVIVRSQTYLSDTTLFQFTESIHRADKFSFSDFARRKKVKGSNRK